MVYFTARSIRKNKIIIEIIIKIDIVINILFFLFSPMIKANILIIEIINNMIDIMFVLLFIIHSNNDLNPMPHHNHFLGNSRYFHFDNS